MTRALLALLFVSSAQAGEPPVRHVRADRAAGGSAAVVVGQGAALFHSPQIFPADAGVEPGAQVESVLNQLDAVLGAAGTGLDRLVKLHVAVDRAELAPMIRQAFAKRLDGRDGPAWTIVVGKLARPGALLAVDAVAIAPANKPAPGRRVFISGQAEADADLAAATRKTLESLEKTLEHLGMDKKQVVQLKAFYLPAESAEIVERETTRFFGESTAPAPPLVLVEWKSPASQPIEIELVAETAEAAPEGAAAVEYLTPPGLDASPVYSRIARVNRGDLIFVSGLVGPEGAGGEKQVEAIFAELKAILAEAGSDFGHMAKATYYVADDVSSRALNVLRPRYYDPSRPPAASKAAVAGVGQTGRSISVDMIAVGQP